MTMMAVVVSMLGRKGGTIPNNGEDLSGNDKMIKDNNNDDDGGSGGVAKDKKGNNAE
jgi:hypothetical protein